MRFMTDEVFVLAILAAVISATILAVVFDAPPDIVAAALIMGVITALAERHFRSQAP
jgi:hypothetical protein